MKHSHHRGISIKQTVAGAALTLGAVAIPFAASHQPVEAAAPASGGCLPILCGSDSDGIDIDLGIDLDVLGGGADDAQPADQDDGAPPPTPTHDKTVDKVVGNVVDLGVDLAVDLGVDAAVGDLAVVDADVPVNVSIGSEPDRPLYVEVGTAPEASASAVGLGAVPVLDVDVTDAAVDLGATVLGGNTSSTPGAPDLLGIGAEVDVCSIAVTLFGFNDPATCNIGDDPSDGPSDDPTDDPGDDASDGPGDDASAGLGDDTTDGPGDDVGVGSAGGTGGDDTATPHAARRSDAGTGSALPVTGTAPLMLVGIATAASLAGAGTLAVRRRRTIS